MISDPWSFFLGAFVFFAVVFGVYVFLEGFFSEQRRDKCNKKKKENEQSKN